MQIVPLLLYAIDDPYEKTGVQIKDKEMILD
jgi:hypothetical protein